jgi:hypothetical protein
VGGAGRRLRGAAAPSRFPSVDLVGQLSVRIAWRRARARARFGLGLLGSAFTQPARRRVVRQSRQATPSARCGEQEREMAECMSLSSGPAVVLRCRSRDDRAERRVPRQIAGLSGTDA